MYALRTLSGERATFIVTLFYSKCYRVVFSASYSRVYRVYERACAQHSETFEAFRPNSKFRRRNTVEIRNSMCLSTQSLQAIAYSCVIHPVCRDRRVKSTEPSVLPEHECKNLFLWFFICSFFSDHASEMSITGGLRSAMLPNSCASQ